MTVSILSSENKTISLNLSRMFVAVRLSPGPLLIHHTVFATKWLIAVSAVVLDPVFLGLSEVSMRGSASNFTPEWRTLPTSGPQQKGDWVPIAQAPRLCLPGCWKVPRSDVCLHMRPTLSPLLLSMHI